MEASTIIEAIVVDPDEKRPLGQYVFKAGLAAVGAALTAYGIKRAFDLVVDRNSDDVVDVEVLDDNTYVAE